MNRTIAIGIVGLTLFANVAGAQTATEQTRILGEFQRSVVDYTQRHQCLDLFPEAGSAAAPAPKIFTLPVAMVFRQMIARARIGQGAEPAHLADALPKLPAPLEYRLIDGDLVIHDSGGGFDVAVLHDAVSTWVIQ